MEFPVLPPEINSVLMYSGVGSSPLLAAAAAWDGLAEELGSAAVSFGQVTSGLTAGVWQGAAQVRRTTFPVLIQLVELVLERLSRRFN